MPFGTDTSRVWAALTASAGAVVLVTVMVTATACSPAAARHDITGTYLLQATYATARPVGPCDSLGNAAAGTTVTLVGDDGRVLASAELAPPQSSDRAADPAGLTTQRSCRWPFRLARIAARDRYTITVGERPPASFSKADMAAQHWQVTIEEERDLVH